MNLKAGELAKLVGISPVTQSHYERGKRCPDAAYLAALLRCGFDIPFLLTGERGQTAGGEILKSDEKLLLDLYRGATPALRKAALAALVGGMSGVHIGRDNNGKISIRHG